MSKRKKNRQKNRPNVGGKRSVAAAFDVARRSPDARKQWGSADMLSADAAMSPAVRKIVRERARQEFWNNAYCSGVIRRIVDDVVGTAPKLQITPRTDDLSPQDADSKRKYRLRYDEASRIEEDFARWADETLFVEKIRQMTTAKKVDGEAFAVLVNNPRLASDVKLDAAVLECDRFTAPHSGGTFADPADGIELDAFGRPVRYYYLSEHPGSLRSAWTWLSAPAENVLHWFKRDRPEQHRGFCEFSSSLQLFVDLRSYTLATIDAARLAASFTLGIYTDQAAETMDGSFGDDGANLPTFPVERGMMTVFPDNWKPSQLKAEQPTTTYADFKWEIAGEIGSSLRVPPSILTGDSHKHNYSSARMDLQAYHKAVAIEQRSLVRNVLDRIFARWWAEYRALNGFEETLPRHRWHFDGFTHVDPLKEAKADSVELENFTKTISDLCAENGEDAEDKIRQRIKELTLIRRLKEECGLISGEEEMTEKDD